jgi:nucleoside-specific outer membrane channel protein Tsx
MRIWVLLLLTLVGFFLLIPPRQAKAQGSYEANSNVQFLYGKNFDRGSRDLATITLEHFGVYRAFEQFGFADIFNNVNLESPDIYVEWYPRFSLGRASGRNINIGPLSDILLGSGINVLLGGSGDFFVYVAGPVWKFEIPGFDLFQLETYYYRQIGEGLGGTYQITPSWDVPIPITDRYRFRTRGFTDFIGDRGPGKAQIIAQPQLLLDIGNFWNKPGGIYFGTEWRYWHNVLGMEGATESIIQSNILIHF